MTRSRDTADTQDNLGGAVAPFVAGKNKIINGDFGIWQRGTSITATFGGDYFFGADRWMMFSPASNTSTFSRQTFTPGTAPVAGYEGAYFARFNCTNSFGTYFQQYIEDVRTFAGQTVTLSFWAKAGSAISLSGNLGQQFGSGGSSFVDTAVSAVSVTTSWQRFSVTVAVPSIAGKTIGTSSYLKWTLQTSSYNVNIDFWGVQIEAGSVATPFTTASGSIGGELALCQRYFQRWEATQFARNGFVYADSTTNVVNVDKMNVCLRTTPTITFTNMTANGNAITAVAAGYIINTNNTFYMNCTTSGVVAGLMYQLYVASGQTGVISYSAEL
jgi:hypothetical protein